MKVGFLRHTKIASFKELNVYCPGRTPRGTFVHRGVRETKFFAFRHFSILVKQSYDRLTKVLISTFMAHEFNQTEQTS